MIESHEQPTNSDKKKPADEIDAMAKIRKMMENLSEVQRSSVALWFSMKYGKFTVSEPHD